MTVLQPRLAGLSVWRETIAEPETVAADPVAPRRWVAVDDTDGQRGWFGPLRISAGPPETLPRISGTVDSVEAFEHWLAGARLPPWLTAAADGAAWDLVSRQAGEPLWRVLRPDGVPGSATAYASVLGVSPGRLDAAVAQLPERWPVVKVSVGPSVAAADVPDVAATIERIAARRVVAFDAHLCDTPPMRTLLNRIYPHVLWIEDPVSLTALSTLPAALRLKTVVGETVCDSEQLAPVCRRGGLWGIQLEPARLGVSAVVRQARQLGPSMRLLLHGHLPDVATTIAAAIDRHAPTLVEHNLRWERERSAAADGQWSRVGQPDRARGCSQASNSA